MALVFADIPEACRNTLAVAERCNLTLDFGRFHLPKYVVPEGHTLETYLQHLAREGLRRRYGPSPGEAIEARLGHELAVIEKMGDRKSTRLNSSHITISYAVFCLKKKKNRPTTRI